MKIEVIGTGCANCKKLHTLTQQAVEKMGVEAEVEYVSEADGMKRLMELGLMRSPALVVDGKVAMLGPESDIDIIASKIAAATE